MRTLKNTRRHTHPFPMTVVDLAELVGITRVHLHRVLRYGTNNAVLAKKLDEATKGGLSAAWLLGLEPKK